MSSKFGRYAVPCAAICLYLAIGVSFAVDSAGLEEDEAFSFRRSVALAEHLQISCQPGYDIKARSVCLPLMIAPYVGAAKDYFLFPLFEIAGLHVAVARMGALLLGAIGIFGIWLLAYSVFGAIAAAVSAGLLALNPSYCDLALFDQGNVAFSLAALGLILVALTLVIGRQSKLRFFALGVCIGLGIWGRLNFAWLVFAGAVAILVVYRFALLKMASYIPALAFGVVIGCAPLLKFLVKNSRQVTQFISATSVPQSFSQKLESFTHSLVDVLFASAEHRGMWHAKAIPQAISIAFLTVAALALVACLYRKNKAAITLVVTILILLLLYLNSGLPISSHHLVIVVPLIALAIGIGLSDLWRFGPIGRVAFCIFCLTYSVTAAAIDVTSAGDLHRSRGYGEWSASVAQLVTRLEAHAGPIYLLDWGFTNPLLLLSEGRLRGIELFWGPDNRLARDKLTWSHLIHAGGQFVTYSAQNLHFPEATIDFQQALAGSKKPFQQVDLKEHDGSPYASIFVVAPSTGLEEIEPPQASHASTLFFAQPAQVEVSDGTGLGQTSLLFWTSRSRFVEIHVGAPNGPLLSKYRSVRSTNSGAATTGKWVRDGTVFFLQDVAGKPLTSQYTLAIVTVPVHSVK